MHARLPMYVYMLVCTCTRECMYVRVHVCKCGIVRPAPVARVTAITDSAAEMERPLYCGEGQQLGVGSWQSQVL